MPVFSAHPGLVTALSGEMTPKFIATRSADGIPNVVPVTSTMPAEDVEDRLIFGNFLLHKSIGNLNADPRVSVLVITTDLEGWVLQGSFAGWQRTGPYADRLMNTDLLRYNPYTGIRNAGIIDVHRVASHFHLSRVRVLFEYLLARAARAPGSAGKGTRMPLPVRQSYSPMTAIRVLAFSDAGGHPLTAPVLSLQPAGDRALVCAEGLFAEDLMALPIDTPVAASLLTLDVVSFQVKGRWLGTHRLLGVPIGAVTVTAAFAGGPPIPGRQVA